MKIILSIFLFVVLLPFTILLAFIGGMFSAVSYNVKED
jgi:hypothetical protein